MVLTVNAYSPLESIRPRKQMSGNPNLDTFSDQTPLHPFQTSSRSPLNTIMSFIASQPTLAPHPNPPPLPPSLEVRCAGCGETLEVEPGLTEFVCPDCHTAQALPPELMPRKRKALPLTRAVDPNRIVQLPCGSCGVLLNLPPGLSRFACPRCGDVLAVDQDKLRAYQAASSVEATPSAPSGVRLPSVVNVELEPHMHFPSYGEVNRSIAPGITPIPSSAEANASTPFSLTGFSSRVQTNASFRPSVSPVPRHNETSAGNRSTMSPVPSQKEASAGIRSTISPALKRKGTSGAIRPTVSPVASRNETNAITRPTIPPVRPRNETNASIRSTISPSPSRDETNTSLCFTISTVPPCKETNTSIPPKNTPVPSYVHTNTSKRQKFTAKQVSLPAPSIPPSVNVEQVETEVGPTSPPTIVPTSKRSKRAKKKQPVVLTTSVPSDDDEEPILRRSTRLANIPAKRNKSRKAPKTKKMKQNTCLSDKSAPDRSEHNGSQHEPQDVAMHNNGLFSADSSQPLTDSTHQHLDTLTNLSSALHLHTNLRSESPVHPGSGLHVQLDPSSEPHPSLSTDHAVYGQHQDQSPNNYTAQVDALSIDEGDEAYDAEVYDSHSDSELASLQSPHNRNGATPGSRRRKRQAIDLWSSSDTNPVELKFNHLGQPVGKEATMLTRLLCTISRDGMLAPVNFTDWRAVPKDCKITIWSLVKSKFKVEEINKKIIMRALGRHWNRWKYTLKQLHYDTHDNDEDRLADINERIQPEQWPFLVHFWSSEEFKKRSAVGKASRSWIKSLHTTGSKSFAQIREEERLKRPNKEEPSRAEMFILTHTRKDGTPIDEEAAIIIARLRKELNNAKDPNNTNTQDDILAKVLRETNNPSLLCCYGLLPKDPRHGRKPDLKEPPTSKEKAKIIAEARRLADEETKPMKEKMDEMAQRHEEMEQRHKEMVEEMNHMRSTMMAMHQLVSARDTGSVPAGFYAANAGTRHDSSL